MPKTVPVPYDLRVEIKKVHALDPTRSARKIAKEFGLHHKTISRILKGDIPYESVEEQFGAVVGARLNDPETAVLTESSKVEGDIWTISMPKTRIHTLDELLEYCEVDTLIWEAERFQCNKWEMGIKKGEGEDAHIEVEPLFQVKATFRKKKDIEAAQKEVEELKELSKCYAHNPVPLAHILSPENLLLELTLPDVHFGKLAWGVETGHANYDVKIAESVYWTALESVLDRVKHRYINEILFVVGNDILNSDDIEGRTTAGTYVSSDARYHKTFAAVRNTQVRAIERLRLISSVKVMMVSGNHDQLSCWHLGDSLECYFHNYSDVTIDNLPRARKYHEHGFVGLMFTHGHKGKRTDYPALMAAEQPQMWGRTKFRECHTGHLHMTKTDEQHGFRTRILPSLTAPDDWLALNGFVCNLRNAEGYVWSAEEGLVEQVYYTVPD